MKSRSIVAGTLIAVFVIGNAYACGPFFDDAYLVRGSEDHFLSIPQGNFLFELERITGQEKIQIEEKDPYANTADADVSDLGKALDKSNMTKSEKEMAIASYADARSQLLNYLKTYPVEMKWTWYGGSFRHHERGKARIPFKFTKGFRFAPTIPKEFVLYMNGAVAYHNCDFNAAIKEWRALLKLPESQRQYRTVWAAFMIGKAYLSMREASIAIDYFEKSREYASEGYSDSINLAKASYGWQALAEYESGDYVASIRNYLKPIDVPSINRVCRKIFGLDDTTFKTVADDEIARQVLIGWVVSHQPYFFYSNDENEDYKKIALRLLAAIEKSETKDLAYNADRIAWIFYNLGDFDKAGRWLDLSQGKSALSQWIRVKLLLRTGKISEAIEILRELKSRFEKNHEWNIFFDKDEKDIDREINSQLGVLYLNRKDYLMAFDVLVKNAYWEDIAYVAEKVLTSEELESYVKDHDIKDPEQHMWLYNASDLEKPSLKSALQYLLARRFARENKRQKALEYMPTVFNRYWYERKRTGRGYYEYVANQETINPKDLLQRYYSHIERAESETIAGRERAKHYFDAALIMRQYGMELFGTELDPDWFVFDGQFAYDSTLENRFALMDKNREEYYKDWFDEIIISTKTRRQKMLKERNFFDGSKDEEARAVDSMPEPIKRFHYRYKAAALMWKCAELLPNNDALKAKALCVGGTYLKDRDKEEADKYYKALVRTCGKTELGKTADEIRWFPEIDLKAIKPTH